MQIHQQHREAALASLGSGEGGLSHAEAQRRLAEYGPNRVERARFTPLPLRFLRELTHLFAAILWIAAALCFAAHRLAPGEGMASLGFAVIAVILVNGVFSFWQEYRAERALAALERLLPHRARVLRAGGLHEVSASEVVPGDLVALDTGDEVPADCRLVEAHGVRANLAMLTGESRPVARDSMPAREADRLLARNVLLAGTSVVGGSGIAVVFATGARTELGRIAGLTAAAHDAPSPLQRELARLTRVVAVLALALGGVFFAIGQAAGISPFASSIFAIGILVANVPEGLLPTVTLSLAMAAQRMARRNALVRHLPSVETLGAATVICTDKTGTLTENRMQVERVVLASGELAAGELANAGPQRAEARRLLEVAAHCHDLRRVEREGRWVEAGDPMEQALVEMARSAGMGAVWEKIDELPFDTDRKRLSTLHRDAEGIVLLAKGAPEALFPLCSRVEREGAEEPLAPERRAAFEQRQQELADRGLRVLALAWRRVQPGEPKALWERDLVLVGLVGLEDPPRPEVPEAIRRCREARVRVLLLTGDHPRTAVAIARRIDLVRSVDPVVLTGDEVARLGPTELQLALDAPEILFARLRPEQKLAVVEALLAKREVVAVTGDGVNDAPALRRAHIGIAMGRSGTDVAKQAADLVLLDDNFASIVSAIEEGRAVFENIRKFMTYILTSNVPEIVPYLAFVLLRIPLPLTVLQILAIDLGTDMLPALGLGAERPDPDVLRRPPRPRGQRLLDAPLLARAYLLLGPLEAAAGMAAYAFVLTRAGWDGGPLAAGDPIYRQATTATLAAVIAMQVANVFVCRSDRFSAFSRGVFANRLLLAGVVIEMGILFAIVQTALGHTLLDTAPLPFAAWLVPLPFALALVAADELRKLLARRRPAALSTS